eukprot:PhM_4_TR14038/c0_g1_i1/m.67807
MSEPSPALYRHSTAGTAVTATTGATSDAKRRSPRRVVAPQGSASFRATSPRFSDPASGLGHGAKKPSVGDYDPHADVTYERKLKPCNSVFRSTSPRFNADRVAPQHTAPISYVAVDTRTGARGVSPRVVGAPPVLPSHFMASTTPRIPVSEEERRLRRLYGTPNGSGIIRRRASYEQESSSLLSQYGENAVPTNDPHNRNGTLYRTSARFATQKPVAPGPGAYDCSGVEAVTSARPTAGGSAKTRSGTAGPRAAVAHVFTSRVPRFGYDDAADRSRGPGAYTSNKGTLAERSAARAGASVRSRSAFGGTAKR